MELELLRLLLKKVKRWELVAEKVKIAKSQEFIPRALTAEGKAHLFRVSQSNPRWYRALYVAVIAVSTTARKHEILRTRFRDVDLFNSVWRISKSKTEAGCRDCVKSGSQNRIRPHVRGSRSAARGKAGKLHLLCLREPSFDYSRPQKSVRTAWRALMCQAGLEGLRIHDLRHTAITDLAEAGIAESVMESMAGHLSARMGEHYTHVRLGAKQKAVAALGGTGILHANADERDARPFTVSTKQ